MISAFLNTDFLVGLQLDNEEENKYPQAKIYNAAGSLVDTSNLNHVSGGLYQNTTQLSSVGTYTITYKVFSDDLRTTKDDFYDSVVAETIVITNEPPEAATIADAVYDEATAEHETSGTFGEKIGKKIATKNDVIAMS